MVSFLWMLTVIPLATSLLTVPCGRVLYPGDAGWPNATYIDNGRSGNLRLPAVVVEAACPKDVIAAVRHAREASMPMAVRGGGHSAAGYSLVKDGLVLDMRPMNASTLDKKSSTVWVQAGAIFKDLYARLANTGVLFAGGGCSHVGVSGFTLGGGLSFLSRAYGLASDNLLSARVVLANSSKVQCSETHNPELFWALRGGGGGNFGVVLDMTFKVHAQNRTQVTEVCWHGNEMAAFALPRYAEWLTSTAHPSVGAPALLLRLNRPATPGQVSFCVTLFATVDTVIPQVDSLVQYVNSSTPPELMKDGCAGSEISSFYEWESRCGALKTGVNGQQGYMMSGVLAEGVTNGVLANALTTALAATPGERTIINLHDGGGKIRANAGIGSFVHRDFNLVFQVKSIWESQKNDTANMRWAAQLWKQVSPFTSGAYVNYIDPKLPDWPRQYYGSNYERLLQIKNSVDPNGFFKFNQSIGATVQPTVSRSDEACEGATQQMYAFQQYQNSMNATGLGQLYTADGRNFIPASAPPIVGREAIVASFAKYFGTLASIHETLVSPMVVNGRFGGFSKQIRTHLKAAPTVERLASVTNWFEFDCSSSPPLITSFYAIFNTSTHQG